MTIKTKFVAEGLETIIAQLKTFGAAGEDMARQLQAAIEKINTKKLEEDLSKVRESSDQMVRSILNFQTVLGATALGVVAKAVYDFATAGIQSAVALERNAAAAGMSTEKFQVLAEALKNAGGSQEQLNTALRRFTMQVDTQGQQQLQSFTDITKDFIKASGGLGGFAFKSVADFDKIREAATRAAPVLRDFLLKALPESLRNVDTIFPVEAIAAKLQQLLQVNQKFRDEFFKAGFDVPAQNIGESLDKILEKSKGTLASLGISLIDIGGKMKTPEKAFLEFVDVVSKLKTPAEQAETIIKLFGRSAGPELAKVIREGTASLEELQAFLESKGILFSPEQLQKAKEADEAFHKLSASYRSFRDQLGIGLSPTFVKIFDSLGKAIEDFGKQMEANRAEVSDWWGTITEIVSSENPFATFWSKASTAFKSSFQDFVEGTKQEIGLLQRVWQITAANPNISPLKALVQAYGEVKAKSAETAQTVTLDWSTSADDIQASFEVAGDAIELNFDQIQKKAEDAAKKVQQSTIKWITPTGTVPAPTAPSVMLTPAAPPTQTTQALVSPFQEADNQIRTIWIDLMDYISTALADVDLASLTAALVAPFTAAIPLIRDELAKVETMIETIMREAAAAAGMIEQLGSGGRPGGGGGFAFQEVASGGYIRGPGTTTSDSIPAWLSNREYVIQARAVDHYGPNLFAALNSMRLPKDLFSHFAVGGLAKALSNAMPKYPPRYATGGMATASAGRSLTIVLDGQKFGLSGSGDVIDRLERVATMAGIASVGRPPGWVR